MEIWRPLGFFYVLGSLGWPVGFFAFGGFENDTGSTTIGLGSLLVLTTMATDLVLRREPDEATARASGEPVRTRTRAASPTTWAALLLAGVVTVGIVGTLIAGPKVGVPAAAGVALIALIALTPQVGRGRRAS